MPTVLASLTRGLDADLRRQVHDRVAAMRRHLAYMRDAAAEPLATVEADGWTAERLDVLLALNAFYQVVLAPLASSAPLLRSSGHSLGERVPILYGDRIRFDGRRAARIRVMHHAFLAALRLVPAPTRLLEANQADDLVRELARALDLGNRG